MLEVAVRPRGPYSLALSARFAGDATRTFRDGVFTANLSGELAAATQTPDGSVVVRGESAAAIERLRFVLALDDDHTPFLRRFADDPLLGESVRVLRGLRPVRTATVAHALLRAFCGQLVDSATARRIERHVVAAGRETRGRLHAPPTRESLGRLAPAELRALGLHARRAAALVRVCRSLDLERLHGLPTPAIVARLGRERGLGPWSLGVLCLQGLGRFDHGLVGDLGLIKLCAALHGRRAEAHDTAELLEPYGEWAGLASVYLLAGYGRGLLPLPRPAAA